MTELTGRARRAKGAGSLYYRGRDGLWVGTVELGKGPNGTRKRRTAASATYCDALKKFSSLHDGAHVPRPTQMRPLTQTEKSRKKADHTKADWALLYLAARGRCFYCGKYAEDLHKDHKTPVSRGGSNGIENIAVSCADCNRDKGIRTAEEYFAELDTVPATVADSQR